jgi:hypothetical protein
MDAAPLTRMRWRLRGAWLWPSFVVLSLADATMIHSLPLSGDSESWVSGWLLGSVLSLLGIVLLGNLCGGVVRRVRPDMPRVVARNYAGALITLAVSLALLAGGLIHQQVVSSDGAALQDATARAEAYIGDHAPAAFQRNLRTLSVVPVEGTTIYRVCAADVTETRDYCVIVDEGQPFPSGVRYTGAEPNWLVAQGAN